MLRTRDQARRPPHTGFPTMADEHDKFSQFSINAAVLRVRRIEFADQGPLWGRPTCLAGPALFSLCAKGMHQHLLYRVGLWSTPAGSFLSPLTGARVTSEKLEDHVKGK